MCVAPSTYRPARRRCLHASCLGPLGSFRQISGSMPSRQERRRAERDAAKRAPRAGAADAAGAARAARAAGASGAAGAAEAAEAAGAAGAAGVAAALANLNVNARGDWTTQAEDPWVLVRARGAEIVEQRAGEGDMEAQFSQGYVLLAEAAEDVAVVLPATSRSRGALVGLAFCAFPPLTRSRCVDGHLT